MATKAESRVKRKAKNKTAEVLDRSYQSTPWNGTVDDDELVRPGGPLLAMLSGRAQQVGHTRGEMAKHLGVTYGYIAQLASGQRQSENISNEFTESCAAYLGLPKVTIMMAAGTLKAKDMFERPDEIALHMPDAMNLVLKHPIYGSVAPKEARSADLSPQMQFFIVRLFEGATGFKLIPGEHSVESIARSLKMIDDLRQKLLKQSHG